MENTQTNSPSEILEGNIKTEVKRVNMPIFKLVLLGILAGMFIAGGAAASNVAMHNISNVGLARLVAGVIFPVGLMMIVLVGGELFTGDCLLILGIMDKKYNVLQAIKVLVIVFITNLLGSVIIAFIVYESGQFNYTDGLLGAFTIKVENKKTGLSFTNAFCSGILCNIFVCLAVLMAASSKQVSGKILGIFFPIMAFSNVLLPTLGLPTKPIKPLFILPSSTNQTYQMDKDKVLKLYVFLFLHSYPPRLFQHPYQKTH